MKEEYDGMSVEIMEFKAVDIVTSSTCPTESIIVPID